jgi:uncharacterized protein with HEPN domain
MSKDPRVYLAHILECILKIERFTQVGRAVFLKDELVQDAVLRNFEVIGEQQSGWMIHTGPTIRKSPGEQ